MIKRDSIYFLFIPFVLIGQDAPPVNGSITTTNGLGINIVSEYLTLMQNTGDDTYVEIQTNIPFQQGKGMTSLYFDYYGYSRVWQTKVGWYVFNNAFFQPCLIRYPSGDRFKAKLIYSLLTKISAHLVSLKKIWGY